MDFCDAPGSNHGTLQAATTNGTQLFFAAPLTEGGWELMEFTPEGAFVRGLTPPMGNGMNRVAVAASQRYLYAAHDGRAWGDHSDRSRSDWKEERMLTVVRMDLKNGSTADFPDKVRNSIIAKYEAGPGAAGVPAEQNPAGDPPGNR